MKFNRVRAKGIALVLVGALAAFPLSAGLIPGVPDLVWDPIQDGHMVQALAHDLQNIAILSQSLQTMQYNIRAFPTRLKTSFQGFTQQFYRPNTGNLFGETGIWRDVMSNANSSYGAVKSGWESSGGFGKSLWSISEKVWSTSQLSGLRSRRRRLSEPG